MLQAVFYAQMASEENHFRIEDALDAINEKLVRRHPHVFGEGTRRPPTRSVNGGTRSRLPRKAQKAGRPAGRRAARAAGAGGGAADFSRAAGVGFDWENAEQVLDKLHEELAEFAQARRNAAASRKWKTNSATCCSCWSTWRAS